MSQKDKWAGAFPNWTFTFPLWVTVSSEGRNLGSRRLTCEQCYFSSKAPRSLEGQLEHSFKQDAKLANMSWALPPPLAAATFCKQHVQPNTSSCCLPFVL